MILSPHQPHGAFFWRCNAFLDTLTSFIYLVFYACCNGLSIPLFSRRQSYRQADLIPSPPKRIIGQYHSFRHLFLEMTIIEVFFVYFLAKSKLLCEFFQRSLFELEATETETMNVPNFKIRRSSGFFFFKFDYPVIKCQGAYFQFLRASRLNGRNFINRRNRKKPRKKCY